MKDATYDAARGFAKLTGRGFYSEKDEVKAARLAAPSIAECLARNGDVKVPVICDKQIQKPAVMEAAASRLTKLSGDYDRVAFVFDTSLAKMEASRYFRGPKAQCFISENAAVTWLLADRGAARVTGA